MKALITGGAGFIGSHLAEALCRRGAQVIVLDDLSFGDVNNLAWRRTGDDLEFVRGDAGDAALVRKLVAGCDWVFHQAAIASVPLSVAKPRESHRANLEATLTLLLAARDAAVKRFVFASSSAIYGDSDAALKHESHAPNPLTPYALQKFASERYGRMFHQFYELETVSLRYFNVFGPRQAFDSPYSGVIAKFCTELLAGRAPTIFGDGLQSRDFVYVANVVHANLLAAEQPAPRVAGQVFNIGGGGSINLIELLAALNGLTGQNLAPVFAPARPGDVRFSAADISAARANLGYEVQVPWRDGLRHTLDFYRG
jgi:UDP-glucose 4-epimerase